MAARDGITVASIGATAIAIPPPKPAFANPMMKAPRPNKTHSAVVMTRLLSFRQNEFRFAPFSRSPSSRVEGENHTPLDNGQRMTRDRCPTATVESDGGER